MAIARTMTVTLLGVEGHPVAVEAHVAPGLPAFVLVGLPDTTMSESRDRVRAAVVNSGRAWPRHRITVSLSPAGLPKSGSHFDLPIGCAVLAAAGAVAADVFAETVLMGELGLDGRLRAVRGVLPAVLSAAAAGFRRVVVPSANAEEARLVPGVEVLAAGSLRQVLARLLGEDHPELPNVGPAARQEIDSAEPRAVKPEVHPDASPGGSPSGSPSGSPGMNKDLADVLGQAEARHALEVCAAGGHNLFLVGPPGAGKTMLAERLPGLLPRLGRDAALEVTAIHSIAGTLPPGAPLIGVPPFQDPHHTASPAAIVGGGSGFPRPGAASLAHRGVLFLDEAPEFSRTVLDALRQPLESGVVTVSRSSGTARYPARFLLLLAANPCPCGLGAVAECRCTPYSRIRYLAKLSGPLLDRIDVRVHVRPVDRATMLADRSFVESSSIVAERVATARARAAARLATTPWATNAEVPGPVLRRRFPLPPVVTQVLERHISTGTLSARGLDRVLRVAWTLADLGARPAPSARDVHAAITLRVSAAGAS